MTFEGAHRRGDGVEAEVPANMNPCAVAGWQHARRVSRGAAQDTGAALPPSSGPIQCDGTAAACSPSSPERFSKHGVWSEPAATTTQRRAVTVTWWAPTLQTTPVATAGAAPCPAATELGGVVRTRSTEHPRINFAPLALASARNVACSDMHRHAGTQARVRMVWWQGGCSERLLSQLQRARSHPPGVKKARG